MSHTTLATSFNLQINKRIFEENYAQLSVLAQKYNLLDVCHASLKTLKNSFTTLFTHIETFTEQYSNQPSENLYEFLHQIGRTKIYDISNVFSEVFYGETNDKDWMIICNLSKNNADQYQKAIKHLSNLIMHVLQNRKVNEFGLFHQIEKNNASHLSTVDNNDEYQSTLNSQYFF